MTQETRPISGLVPYLIAALVCDVAVQDPSTAKKNLIGIFDRINVSKFPTKHPMTVYIKLTDAQGDYQMEIKYVQVSTGKVLAAARGEMHATNLLASSDLYIEFRGLPIPNEGRYEFQIWANSMFLGSTFIDAVPQQRR